MSDSQHNPLGSGSGVTKLAMQYMQAAGDFVPLAKLKEQRDALNDQIKLMEDGIRKGAEQASYSSQLIAVNEARLAAGKRQISMSEFAAGIIAEADNE